MIFDREINPKNMTVIQLLSHSAMYGNAYQSATKTTTT